MNDLPGSSASGGDHSPLHGARCAHVAPDDALPDDKSLAFFRTDYPEGQPTTLDASTMGPLHSEAKAIAPHRQRGQDHGQDAPYARPGRGPCEGPWTLDCARVPGPWTLRGSLPT